MDRRLTPATARVAHVSLRGRLDAASWTEGQVMQVAMSLVDLLATPHGARERQLGHGEGFVVVDRDMDHVFGFAQKDGYCGWLPEAAVGSWVEPTHWVASSGTHLYPEPRLACPEVGALPMGARVRVEGRQDKWAATGGGYVPALHLRKLGDWRTDPVAVAEDLVGTPYLWGGNSRAGVDCSGLVQMAHQACGSPLPGDSDLQQEVGREIAADAPHQRGDLLFWQGHVAMVVDATRLIHANGFTMSVAYEGTDACIARIAAAEGPLRARRRV